MCPPSPLSLKMVFFSHLPLPPKLKNDDNFIPPSQEETGLSCKTRMMNGNDVLWNRKHILRAASVVACNTFDVRTAYLQNGLRLG